MQKRIDPRICLNHMGMRAVGPLNAKLPAGRSRLSPGPNRAGALLTAVAGESAARKNRQHRDGSRRSNVPPARTFPRMNADERRPAPPERTGLSTPVCRLCD